MLFRNQLLCTFYEFYEVNTLCLVQLVKMITNYFQESEELQKKQSWFQKNQLNMTKEDEDEYHAFCSDALLRIHILKQRLDRYVIADQFRNVFESISVVSDRIA